MTDVTGGPVPSSTPSSRDLEELGTETQLNGLSSGDDSLGSLEGEGESRSFGASTGATGDAGGAAAASLGASSSGTFGGGAQSSGGASFGDETGSAYGGASSLGGQTGQTSRTKLLQDGKEVASAKAQQARQWAGDFSSRQADTFKSRVTEKPLETSVAVFGLGLIVGLLLRR